MNCLQPMRKPTYKRFWNVLGMGLALGLIIGMTVGTAITSTRAFSPDAFEPVAVTTTPPVCGLTLTSTPYATPSPLPTIDPLPVPPERVPLGEYRITAYCGCHKCCGQWADDRPNGVVFGAAGVELQPGISAASPLPFGTELEIEGVGTYIVQDRIANWVVDRYDGKVVDIYFADHEAACEFALQYHDVYIVGEAENE